MNDSAPSAPTSPAEPHLHQPYHLPLAELNSAFHHLPKPPNAKGRLIMIVRRLAPGHHEVIESAVPSLEEGLPGDEWNRRLPKSADGQLTVICYPVAKMVANGQPLNLSGDNLIVDLDISSENLPIGSRLKIGEAEFEVTPKPHNGCHKFARRFGRDAVAFVNAPATRHLNLRGIYWRVIVPGEVKTGSEIQILSRGKNDPLQGEFTAQLMSP
jgi:MOSC domain-containing protein YiiM